MTTPTMLPEQTMVGTANGVGIWVAPERTDAPSGINAEFEAPWHPLGYASDDGVTLGGDTTVESFTPWQSRTPIRSVITEKSKTVGFTMWQLNQRTLGLYFDQNITGTLNQFNFEVRSDSPQVVHAIGIDALDGDRHLRLVYPRATLESTGDMTLTRGAMVPLEVTLSALDDAGVLVHVWVAHPAASTLSEPETQSRSGGRSRQPAGTAAE